MATLNIDKFTRMAHLHVCDARDSKSSVWGGYCWVHDANCLFNEHGCIRAQQQVEEGTQPLVPLL